MGLMIFYAECSLDLFPEGFVQFPKLPKIPEFRITWGVCNLHTTSLSRCDENNSGNASSIQHSFVFIMIRIPLLLICRDINRPFCARCKVAHCTKLHPEQIAWKHLPENLKSIFKTASVIFENQQLGINFQIVSVKFCSKCPSWQFELVCAWSHWLMTMIYHILYILCKWRKNALCYVASWHSS